MLNPMQMRSNFSGQRPIRLFCVVSDSLKMLFPHATTRPLKAMEAYRVAVMGLHREGGVRERTGRVYAGSDVALLLHFYFTAKIEDFIAKLKQFSKLDFQSKREMINNGRPMPELKGMLQATGQKITRSTSHIQSQIALKMFGTSRINLVLN